MSTITWEIDMKQKHKIVIKETLKMVFDWIKVRKPGQVLVDWSIVPEPTMIVIELSFPSLKLTEEESHFLPAENRLFSMNGSTPMTLQDIEKARERINEMGGQLAVQKLPSTGMLFELYFPANGNNLDDIVEKIRLIQNEIKEEGTPF